MSNIELCPTCLRPASMRKASEIDVQSRQAEADRLNAFVSSIEAAVCHAVGVDQVAARLSALEPENKDLRARVAELEAENKHLTQLLDGYRVHADAHRALLAKYDAEKNGWLDIVGKASYAIDLFAKLEARWKRLEEVARAVYLDSIASDHPWTELETRNMHALRDVLEAKP